MAPLRNQRHEAFANLIAKRDKTGMSNTACYLGAGYSAVGNAAEVAASRLLSSDQVQRRIAEINAPVVKKTRATVDSLATQFDEVFAGAMGSAQFGAAGQAAAAKAKLLGFMREKIEVGSPADFSACSTPAEVIKKLIADAASDDDPASWPDVLRDMADLIEAELASQALPVSNYVHRLATNDEAEQKG